MSELTRACFVRDFASLLPDPLRRRIARAFYNYDSQSLCGAEVVVDYIKDLNLKFAVNTKEFIGWNIFFMGSYEEPTNRILRQFVKKDNVVLEAGANNGSETVLLGRLVGEQGKVFAFEPVQSVLKQLRKNVELNGLEHVVELCDTALGAKTEDVDLYLMPGEAYNQGMSSTTPFLEAKHKVSVKQVTLDEWIAPKGISRLDLIKMDIQGGEYDLLCGGAKTIQQFRPFIFCEADDLGSHSLEELHSKLIEFGYTVSAIKGKSGRLEQIKGKPERGNWWATPNSR